MLDLEPRVQLHEVEAALRAEQELERARIPVAELETGALDRGLHLLTQRGRERGRGRLLDQLLVPPLDRAFALAEREDSSLPVRKHLDLDVPRRNDRLLEVQAAVAERGVRLGGRALEDVLELVGRLHEAHPAAPASRRRLQQDGIAELVGRGARVVWPNRVLRAGDERHLCLRHRGLRLDLVAHLLHGLGRRADEDEVVVRAGAHECGVLGEEAPAGMDGVAAGRLPGRHD